MCPSQGHLQRFWQEGGAVLEDTHFRGCWTVALSQLLCTCLTPHDSQCGGSAISPTFPIRKMTEVQSHIVCTCWPSHPGLSPEPWPKALAG